MTKKKEVSKKRNNLLMKNSQLQSKSSHINEQSNFNTFFSSPNKNNKNIKVFKKKNIIKLVKIFVAFLILTSLVISGLTFKSETFKALKSVHKGFLVLALFLSFLALFINALRIKYITFLMTKKYISIKYSLKVLLTGMFLTGITPFQTGGTLLQMYLLHKKKISIGESASILIFAGITYAFFVAIAIPFLILKGEIPINSVFIYSMCVYFILFISLFAVLLKPLEIRDFFKKKMRLKKGSRFLSLLDELVLIRQSFIRAFKSPLGFLFVLFLTITYMLIFYLIAPILLYSFGIHVNVIRLILVQMIIIVLTFMLPTPGAVGGIEALFMLFLKPIVPNYLLGIVVLLWRFIVSYIPTFIGGILTMRLLFSKNLRNKEE